VHAAPDPPLPPVAVGGFAVDTGPVGPVTGGVVEVLVLVFMVVGCSVSIRNGIILVI
jgi:hypothetical protein